MNPAHKCLLILLAAAVLGLAGLPVVPVSASSGLSVNRLVLQTDVAPGNTKTLTMAVSSAVSDPAMNVLVELTGLGQFLDGTYQELAEDDDRNRYSARSFITISPEEFHLEPGGCQDIEVTVHIPDNAGKGGRYAIIYVRAEHNSQGQVSIGCNIGIPVVLTIKDTELLRTGKITDFSVGEIVLGEPVDITAIFNNTGNYHYKARAKATLRDESGRELGTAATSLTAASIIPTYSREFKLSLSPPQESPPGRCYIDLEVLDEEGEVVDARSTKRNWLPIIGGIAGGCALIGLLVYFLVFRKGVGFHVDDNNA